MTPVNSNFKREGSSAYWFVIVVSLQSYAINGIRTTAVRLMCWLQPGSWL